MPATVTGRPDASSVNGPGAYVTVHCGGAPLSGRKPNTTRSPQRAPRTPTVRSTFAPDAAGGEVNGAVDPDAGHGWVVDGAGCVVEVVVAVDVVVAEVLVEAADDGGALDVEDEWSLPLLQAASSTTAIRTQPRERRMRSIMAPQSGAEWAPVRSRPPNRTC